MGNKLFWLNVRRVIACLSIVSSILIFFVFPMFMVFDYVLGNWSCPDYLCGKFSTLSHVIPAIWFSSVLSLWSVPSLGTDRISIIQFTKLLVALLLGVVLGRIVVGAIVMFAMLSFALIVNPRYLGGGW